jgi:hypothetical protein
MRERRRLNRWQVNGQARVKLEGAEVFTSCSLKDINLKGAQISLARKLPTDTFLKINLVLAEDFILNVEVWIAWHRIIDGHNIYGFYFSKRKEVRLCKRKSLKTVEFLRVFPQTLA